MNYLLNNNFKILRKGSHVVANEKVGEFLYDDENTDFEIGILKEIAEANGLQCSGKKKSQYQQSLNEALKMLDVAEQNGPTETEKVEKIVQAGFDAGHDDDTMMIAIVQAGISFRRASRMFKDAVEKLGLRVGVKDVKEVARKLLAEMDFNPQSYGEIQKVAEKLVSEVEGSTAAQAMVAIKSYAKENEIALPKREKGSKKAGPSEGSGFKYKVMAWILENPNFDTENMEGFKSFLAENERTEEKEISAYVRRYVPIVKFARQFAVEHAGKFE